MTKLTIGASSRAAHGEQVIGDAYVVVTDDDEVTTFALADGLGHGPGALDASQALCRYVETHAHQPLDVILAGVDPELAKTRGAVAALVRVDPRDAALHFCGVGNIELLAASQVPIRPVSVPGIVGYRRKRLRVFEYPLTDGDIVALISDGVSREIDLERFAALAPSEMARAIVDQHGKSHDDASCVVMRYGVR